MNLAEAARKWHSPKMRESGIAGAHNYGPIYEQLLSDRPIRKIVEFGLGPKGLAHPDQVAGSCLFMWAELFPEAQIFGFDYEVSTFVNQRMIQSFYCDQRLPSSLFHAAIKVGHDVDLIIDDGSHDPEDQLRTARIFAGRLSDTGVYVIEDVLERKQAYAMSMHFFGSQVIELDTDTIVDDRLVVIDAKEANVKTQKAR